MVRSSWHRIGPQEHVQCELTTSMHRDEICLHAGHAEILLGAMEDAGVAGALIIQPGNHGFDHSYVTSVLQAHPDKFVGMLLANPTEVSRILARATRRADSPRLSFKW
jgi:hypothetical protein